MEPKNELCGVEAAPGKVARGGARRGRAARDGARRGGAPRDATACAEAARGGRTSGSGSARGRSCARTLDFFTPPSTRAAAARQAPAPTSSTSALPAESLRVKLSNTRANRAKEKKKLATQSPEFQAELRAKRAARESISFLLPDAPPKKKSTRNQSPPRVSCPLAPGVPVTPPPRKPRRWQLQDSTDSNSNYSSSSDMETTPTKPPQANESDEPLLFAPSFDMLQLLEVGEDTTVVRSEIEFIGFPSTSSCGSIGAPSPTASGSEFGAASFTDHSSILDWPTPGPSQAYLIAEYEKELGDESDSDHGEKINMRDVYPEEAAARMMSQGAREDAALRTLAAGDDDLISFQWCSEPATFTAQREPFTGREGPTFDTSGMSPLDMFKKIWDRDIILSIVRETNRFAHQTRSGHPEKLSRWVDVTETDLWAFFAVIMLQSVVLIPVEREYWQPCLPELRIGNFNSIMSYRKFIDIKKCLSFINETTMPTEVTGANKKLAKIQPIIDHLNSKFSSLYLPGQNIAIDESLLLWKGHLSFAQLIATKAARVGIKSYQLCDSRTGYLWQTIVYAGKGESHEGKGIDEDNMPEGATSQLVYALVRPLLNKGHTLVMDNFYNSPLLSRMLKRQKTDTMGTLRLNREFVPDSLRCKTKKDMRPGEVVVSHTHDLTITVWRNSNLVAMISSYHKTEVGGKEKYGLYKYKPQVVLDYNLSMGGVDKLDQMLQAFPVERIRNTVWYKKLFRRLLNVSIYNAYVIFSHGKTNQTQRTFRVGLVREILKEIGSLQPKVDRHPTGHYPMKFAGGGRRCKNCSSKGVVSRSIFGCQACKVRLCVEKCFMEYHVSMFAKK